MIRPLRHVHPVLLKNLYKADYHRAQLGVDKPTWAIGYGLIVERLGLDSAAAFRAQWAKLIEEAVWSTVKVHFSNEAGAEFIKSILPSLCPEEEMRVQARSLLRQHLDDWMDGVEG